MTCFQHVFVKHVCTEEHSILVSCPMIAHVRACLESGARFLVLSVPASWSSVTHDVLYLHFFSDRISDRTLLLWYGSLKSGSARQGNDSHPAVTLRQHWRRVRHSFCVIALIWDLTFPFRMMIWRYQSTSATTSVLARLQSSFVPVVVQNTFIITSWRTFHLKTRITSRYKLKSFDDLIRKFIGNQQGRAPEKNVKDQSANCLWLLTSQKDIMLYLIQESPRTKTHLLNSDDTSHTHNSFGTFSKSDSSCGQTCRFLGYILFFGDVKTREMPADPSPSFCYWVKKIHSPRMIYKLSNAVLWDKTSDAGTRSCRSVAGFTLNQIKSGSLITCSEKIASF